MGTSGGWFKYPHPVNETRARVTAGFTALTVAAILWTQQGGLLIYLTLEFLARVLCGPRFSLASRLAKVVVTTLKLPRRPVPGPPKRFAQFVGLLFTLTACILWFGLHRVPEAKILLWVLGGFAILESVFGFCAGCMMFNMLMKVGVIPESACAACRDWQPNAQPSSKA